MNSLGVLRWSCPISEGISSITGVRLVPIGGKVSCRDKSLHVGLY